MSPPLKHPSTYSLRKRLVLASGVLLILFLGFTGLVLDRAFKESVAAAVEERLQLQIYALLGVAEPEGDGFFVPDLEDPRFSQIDSGLYGLIYDDVGTELWRSASALNVDLARSVLSDQAVEPGQTVFNQLETDTLGRLSYAMYGIYWSGQDSEYRFMVLESTAPSAAEISEFQSNLWLWLGGLTILLSLVQYPLLRWGLSPLKQLADEVSGVESGQADMLQGHYPSELQAVSDNLNLLIKSERDRQKRYQTTLGDLAHSLKTPLAVISGVVQDSSAAEKAGLNEIHEQVERMNQIVGYQLKRAAQSQHNPLMARQIEVGPVIDKLLSALNKVYRDKGVTVQQSIEPALMFLGEESDLMEVCGNLLDNAFKYTQSWVKVEALRNAEGLHFIFTDNGNGISESQQKWVLERGARADTVMSGQGIGLAVAADIISSYGGSLEVGDNSDGGARIQVLLP